MEKVYVLYTHKTKQKSEYFIKINQLVLEPLRKIHTHSDYDILYIDFADERSLVSILCVSKNNKIGPTLQTITVSGKGVLF